MMTLAEGYKTTL